MGGASTPVHSRRDGDKGVTWTFFDLLDERINEEMVTTTFFPCD